MRIYIFVKFIKFIKFITFVAPNHKRKANMNDFNENTTALNLMSKTIITSEERHNLEKKAIQTAFLLLFSSQRENLVSILSREWLRHLWTLLHHDEAIHGTVANLKPATSVNFTQDFKSFGVLVIPIYPIM
jgi:hypothetical protein